MLSLFVKTMADHRRALLGWSLGLIAYAFLIVVTFPSTKGINFDQLAEDLKFFMGGAQTLSSLEGYLTSQIFYVPLALGVYAVFLSARLVAAEIRSGGMDFLLSHPLSRFRVIAAKFLALTAVVSILSLIFAVGLWLAGLLIEDELKFMEGLLVGINLIPIVLVYGSFGFCLGCTLKRRGAILGYGSALAVFTWVLHGLSLSSDLLSDIEGWTVFHWYATGKPFSDGLVPAHMSILVVLSAALFIISAWQFNRRDI